MLIVFVSTLLCIYLYLFLYLCLYFLTSSSLDACYTFPPGGLIVMHHLTAGNQEKSARSTRFIPLLKSARFIRQIHCICSHFKIECTTTFRLGQVAWFFQTTSRLVDRFMPVSTVSTVLTVSTVSKVFTVFRVSAVNIDFRILLFYIIDISQRKSVRYLCVQDSSMSSTSNLSNTCRMQCEQNEPNEQILQVMLTHLRVDFPAFF